MSYKVSGTTITLTQGDIFMAQISITDSSGEPYVLSEGDSVRFATKAHYTDEDTLLVKDIPIDTLKLVLNPEDTKDLAFETYVYDVQLTKAFGEVDTFITTSQTIQLLLTLYSRVALLTWQMVQ